MEAGDHTALLRRRAAVLRFATGSSRMPHEMGGFVFKVHDLPTPTFVEPTADNGAFLCFCFSQAPTIMIRVFIA